MSDSIDLRELTADVLADVASDDRHVIAKEIAARIPHAAFDEALHQALLAFISQTRQMRARSATLGTSSLTLRERLERRTERIGDCLIWRGKGSKDGYGQILIGGNRPGSTQRVHRVSYLEFVGPIPAGLTLDHLCHTRDETCAGGRTCLHRRCWNPAHLEPVTAAENLRRRRRSGPKPGGHRAVP